MSFEQWKLSKEKLRKAREQKV